MADNSYQPGVYREQGGNKLFVKSTGIIQWGECDTATTAATIPNNGVTIVVGGTTATGANSYTLAAPQPGQTKYISCSTANTSDVARIIGPTTTVLFGVGTGKPRLNITDTGTVTLVGFSTLVWHVVNGSTAAPIANVSS
jgi:hypothetical protein